MISQGGKRLLQLVDDIIDVASSSDGRLRLNESPLDLAQVVHLAYIQMLPGAKVRDIHIRVELDPGLPPVWGDGERLRQALRHILDNSIKFSREGGEVFLHAGLREDGALALVIEDRGIGMDAGTRRAAFTLFRQGDGSLSRRHGGLGLGLTLAHNIITLHGGTISLSSEPGAGTRVTLLLPRERLVPRAP